MNQNVVPKKNLNPILRFGSSGSLPIGVNLLIFLEKLRKSSNRRFGSDGIEPLEPKRTLTFKMTKMSRHENIHPIDL